MDERNMPFRVGVVFLATVLIAVILFVWLNTGSISLWHRTHTFYVKFDKAPHVTPDTPIVKDGITIGRVRNVTFSDDDTKVLVTGEIDQAYRLNSNEQCRVTNSFPMGDAALEIVPITNSPGKPAEIKYGSYMPALESSAPDLSGSIAGLQSQASQTMATLDAAGKKIETLATRVDDLVKTNEEQINQTITEARETIHLLKSEMPVVLKETRNTMERMGDSFASLDRNMQKIGNSFASLEYSISGTFTSLNRSMQDIEHLTGPLGEHGEKLVNDLDATMGNVKDATGNLLLFSQKLNDPQGSLGALLHDKDLYQNVNHVAKNIDDLTRELKPLLNDARVFTDKIARHPELLGVRGAIKKDVGLKDSFSNDGSETDAPPETGRWPIGGSGRWSIGR